MTTLLKIIRLTIPLLTFLGLVNSCKKDDKDCNEEIDYSKCVICDGTIKYANGTSYSDSETFCPSSYTTAELQQYVNQYCSLNGITYNGNKYTVNCHN